jgi:hypothetical protein
LGRFTACCARSGATTRIPASSFLEFILVRSP